MSAEGPWGKEHPPEPVNEARERVMAMETASKYLTNQVVALAKQQDFVFELEQHANAAGNIGHISFGELTGDIKNIEPVLVAAVEEINRDFLTRNIHLEATVSFQEGPGPGKRGFVVTFLSR